MDLNDYFYFAQVVEKRGFAAASRATGVPKSRLSRHVQQLEERLGVKLIQRSPRQFHVTDIGQAFYNQARAALDHIDAAEAAINNQSKEISGRVTISCSASTAQFVLKEVLSNFLCAHPGVEIAMQVTGQSVDLIEEGIDFAIRGHTNDLPDSSLIQRLLADVPWGLFASPNFLEIHGHPETPDDLNGLDGLKLGWTSHQGVWSLTGPDDLSASIPYNSRLTSDDMVTLKNAAIRGLGILAVPAYTCRDEVKSDRLVRLLPEWIAAEARLTLLMPSRRGTLPAVNALVDYLTEEIPAYTQL